MAKGETFEAVERAEEAATMLRALGQEHAARAVEHGGWAVYYATDGRKTYGAAAQAWRAARCAATQAFLARPELRSYAIEAEVSNDAR